ncbi:early nodulin-like protein 2 [Panicum miliaceum]|uniref:Early nodulin-like protein 2 n=1 Tax=Panicum miliaceum TaxID=4540 RepID=A0A3L6R1Z8_PANMI|nr:early nodulin-like protein 2 [Panicum miliaceum]
MAARMVVGVAVALLAVLLAAATGADGRDFHVGGRAGWAPNPAEPFNTWAERNRFQVNDTLVFRYNKDADAVLVVTPSHYDACNTTEPVLRLDGGDTRFVFNGSGPYFFISADEGRCRAGERLIVVVLAVRNNSGGNTPSPPKSSSSPPTSPPPVATPAPRALPPPPLPPKSSSSSPPVAAPALHALPPPPPTGKNASSPAPAPAPTPAATNGTSSPPPPSSAVALRGGVLACLIIGGAAILV